MYCWCGIIASSDRAGAQEALSKSQAQAKQAEAESAARLAGLEASLLEANKAQQAAAEARLSSGAAQLGQANAALDALRAERDGLLQTQVTLPCSAGGLLQALARWLCSCCLQAAADTGAACHTCAGWRPKQCLVLQPHCQVAGLKPPRAFWPCNGHCRPSHRATLWRRPSWRAAWQQRAKQVQRQLPAWSPGRRLPRRSRPGAQRASSSCRCRQVCSPSCCTQAVRNSALAGLLPASHKQLHRQAGRCTGGARCAQAACAGRI